MKVAPSSSTGAILGLTALSFAHASRKCSDLSIEVPVVARNAVFNLTPPKSNIDVINFVLDMTQQGHNLTKEVLTGLPLSGLSWDVSINNYNYSYVAQAVDHGYSTFAWDRLGIAESQHGEPINEIQSHLEIAALYSLTEKLREGSVDGIETGFDKVVHVGHSFGSIQSYSLAVLYPGVSDGLVLTGFSHEGQFIPYWDLGANLVPANSLSAFKDYQDGYIADGDVSAVQSNLFAPGAFDPVLLDLAYTSRKPATIGELLSIAGATAFENPLTGPVLIITGGRDIPFCGGDCFLTGNVTLPNLLELSRPLFPATSNFEAVVVDGAGHGLNFEYSHPFTYSTILDFITQNVGY